MLAAEADNYLFQRPKRAVAIRRDGDDFVVSLMPNDVVIFRNESADALRKLCKGLRWAVVSDFCDSLRFKSLNMGYLPRHHGHGGPCGKHIGAVGSTVTSDVVGLLTILCELMQFVSDECCCAGYASSAPFTPFAARVHPRQKSRKRIGDNSV